MITNYIPNTCKYNVNNLKKVVHIFSEASNKVYIDNGEAYVDNLNGTLQAITGTSISFTETTSFNDRFQFVKEVSLTVDGYVNLSALNGKYYVVLEDEHGTYWLVNYDFPSFVTYTYTLEDGTEETVFKFSALSNFPTLKLNISITNAIPCKSYSLVKVDKLKMLEKRYASISESAHTVYGYSNAVYKTVNFLKNSLVMTEEFDGSNVNTSIAFDVELDEYKSSWHYNLLEYQNNKYVAIVNGHLACGFEMGLVPSYNAQGNNEVGLSDKVTITLNGSSQRGSIWADSWSEVSLEPQYTWRITKEWMCTPTIYRWVESGTTCVGFDKYEQCIKQYSVDDGETWKNVVPTTYSATTLIEADSEDCGYVPPAHDYSQDYFTVAALDDGTIGFSAKNLRTINPQKYGVLKYSKDSGTTWVDVTNSTTLVNVVSGDEIIFKGYYGGGGKIECSLYEISSTCRIVSKGNIMSLIYLDDFIGQTDISDSYLHHSFDGVFAALFRGCTMLINAEHMVLPATNLGAYCYSHMFDGCTNLLKAPSILPSMSGKWFCYACMFQDCTSLTTSPNMFIKSLYDFDGGYFKMMFSGCTSLSAVTCIATGQTAYDSGNYPPTEDWLSDVSENGVFYKHPDATVGDGNVTWRIGTNGIPSGWTIQNVQTRETSGTPYCDGFDKYEDVYSEVSCDGGETWVITATTKTLLEVSSSDCGASVPTTAITYTSSYKLNVPSTGFTPNVTAETFDSSTSAGTIEFPSSVTSLGKAFRQKYSLRSVIIPESVTSFGDRSFYECANLVSLTIYATNPPSLGSNTLYGTSGSLVIYVPRESLERYKSASGWSNYASRIQPIV